MMTSAFEKTELDNIGHAISTLIQHRYVWLCSHISRGLLLDRLDKEGPSAFGKDYYFSRQDQAQGAPPIPMRHITDLLSQSVGAFAETANGSGKRYDHNFVREITLTGIRGVFLVAIQSELEYFGILEIARRHTLPCEEMFLFIRQARNIICHAKGSMDSDRIRPCEWRGIRIEKCNRVLTLTDQQLRTLVEDAIETLTKIYSENNRTLDFVSLNLGYTIPCIKELADAKRCEDEPAKPQ